MILAGDIGGTKTLLALFDPRRPTEPLQLKRFASGEHSSLEEILQLFLESTSPSLSAAAFGVAGPVSDGRAKITNLPWLIESQSISEVLSVGRTEIINDLKAIATAIPHLSADAVQTLWEGQPEEKGAIAVVAPGTGLGEAFLVHNGRRYRAFPTEGGHASFAPNTREEINLLLYLKRRFGHVSFERVCSGSGLPNIYEFLHNEGHYDEPDWLQVKLREADDRTPVIVQHGLQGDTGICVATLDMFVRIYGGIIGNMILKLLATGGVYLSGGMSARLLPMLQTEGFRESIISKGRFTSLCERIPIRVVADPLVALRGAAIYAAESLADE